MCVCECVCVCHVCAKITFKIVIFNCIFKILPPCRVGSVGSVSASRKVGREFASRPGHTKDHHKNGTNCLPACVRVGVWQCSPTV